MKDKNNFIWIISLSGLLILFIGAMLLFFGVSSNYIATTENGCKMPVFSELSWSTQTHFTYNNSKEVNNSILTDIFYIGNYIYSIGDFLLYFGFTFLALGTLTHVFIIIKIIYKKDNVPNIRASEQSEEFTGTTYKNKTV
mgnify:CR=1 FL=1